MNSLKGLVLRAWRVGFSSGVSFFRRLFGRTWEVELDTNVGPRVVRVWASSPAEAERQAVRLNAQFGSPVVRRMIALCAALFSLSVDAAETVRWMIRNTDDIQHTVGFRETVDTPGCPGCGGTRTLEVVTLAPGESYTSPYEYTWEPNVWYNVQSYTTSDNAGIGYMVDKHIATIVISSTGSFSNSTVNQPVTTRYLGGAVSAETSSLTDAFTLYALGMLAAYLMIRSFRR